MRIFQAVVIGSISTSLRAIKGLTSAVPKMRKVGALVALGQYCSTRFISDAASSDFTGPR